MASDPLKTHQTTKLCCLKIRLENVLKECQEFSSACNRTGCLEDIELYKERPFVNFRFTGSERIKRVSSSGSKDPDAKKLTSTASKGYQVVTTAIAEIIVLQCRDDHNTFCHASGINEYLKSLFEKPGEWGMKNVEWDSEIYRTFDKGHGQLTYFAVTYSFTYNT